MEKVERKEVYGKHMLTDLLVILFRHKLILSIWSNF